MLNFSAISSVVLRRLFFIITFILSLSTSDGVLLMILHHKHHIIFSELALRFYLFESNKVTCDKNGRLEFGFQIDAKQ